MASFLSNHKSYPYIILNPFLIYPLCTRREWLKCMMSVSLCVSQAGRRGDNHTDQESDPQLEEKRIRIRSSNISFENFFLSKFSDLDPTPSLKTEPDLS